MSEQLYASLQTSVQSNRNITMTRMMTHFRFESGTIWATIDLSDIYIYIVLEVNNKKKKNHSPIARSDCGAHFVAVLCDIYYNTRKLIAPPIL